LPRVCQALPTDPVLNRRNRAAIAACFSAARRLRCQLLGNFRAIPLGECLPLGAILRPQPFQQCRLGRQRREVQKDRPWRNGNEFDKRRLSNNPEQVLQIGGSRTPTCYNSN
jgi:hypothetical protein